MAAVFVIVNSNRPTYIVLYVYAWIHLMKHILWIPHSVVEGNYSTRCSTAGLLFFTNNITHSNSSYLSNPIQTVRKKGACFLHTLFLSRVASPNIVSQRILILENLYIYMGLELMTVEFLCRNAKNN